jgi:cell division protein FtsN
VNGNSAYEGDMNEVVLFESALRAAVPTRPDPRIGAVLVPRLAEAARIATLEADTRPVRQRPRSRFALVARVGIAVALIPLVLAGLAFAGVTVPSPARSAFESVGINLPNQPEEHAAADEKKGSGHGKAAGSDGATTDTTSKGKSEAAHKHALEQHEKAQGKALGHEKGKAIGLNGATPPGQANKPSHPSHPSNSGGNAGGNSAAHTTTLPRPEHTTPTTPGGNGNGHTK